MEQDKAAVNDRSRLIQASIMSMVRIGVRGTSTRDTTNRSSGSSNNMGRMMDAFRSSTRSNTTRSKIDSDCGNDDDEVSTENNSDDMQQPNSGIRMESFNSSNSDDERRGADLTSHRRKQQQQQQLLHVLQPRHRTIKIPKGDQILRDTSGNTDVSSSTASATSDSDCDDSFTEVNDDDVTGTRKVRFSDVSMRTYSLVLGETQASKSYPISLDWAHTPTTTIDISVFELLYSSSRNVDGDQGKMIRGFRLPRRLRSAQRLELLSTVTGQKPEEIYESNLARITREQEYIPESACCSDDGYVEMRDEPYQMIDSDDYVQVVI